MSQNLTEKFPWPVAIRRSSRSRRLSLRIDPRTEGAVLSMPENFPEDKAVIFIKAHAHWIEKQLASLPPKVTQSNEICFEGKILPIHRIPAPSFFRPILYPDRLEIRNNDPDEAMRIEAFLKACAKTRLPALFRYWSHIMALNPSKLSIRDARSRWGSCNAHKAIMLNWRLIFAPKSVQNYVIIHELSHLVHFNHSPDFWAHVEKFCPKGKIGRKESEKWLKIHGIKLQRTL